MLNVWKGFAGCFRYVKGLKVSSTPRITPPGSCAVLAPILPHFASNCLYSKWFEVAEQSLKSTR